MKHLMLTVCLLFSFAFEAKANIIIEQGTESLSWENIHLDTTGPATQITGHIGTTTQGVLFSGHELLEGSEGGGTASVNAVDGGLTYLDISLINPTGTFDAIEFSLKREENHMTPITIEALDQSNTIFSKQFSLNSNGETWFTIFSVLPETIKKIIITSGTEFQVASLKHARIDPSNPVPEPATMLLFGTGIIGLVGVIRKKRS